MPAVKLVAEHWLSAVQHWQAGHWCWLSSQLAGVRVPRQMGEQRVSPSLQLFVVPQLLGV